MRFKKGSKLPVEERVLPITDEEFAKEYVAAIKADPVKTFGVLKEGKSFLRILLGELGIKIEESVSRSLQYRLKNKFASSKCLIEQIIQKSGKLPPLS